VAVAKRKASIIWTGDVQEGGSASEIGLDAALA
jgi:hypothetical protein